MKANEFRIGNTLGYLEVNMTAGDEIVNNYSCTLNDIAEIKRGNICNRYRYTPLTTDTLLKSGFTFDRDNERFVIDVLGSTLYLRKAAQGGFLWGFVDDNEEHILFELFNVKPIKYVHKLQNLYFALTDGEELPMNVLLINEGDK